MATSRFVPLAAAFIGVSSAACLEPADVLIFSRDPLLVRPQLGVSGSYNDNIFAQEIGESDFVTTFSPGINIQFGRQAVNYVILDYRLNQHFYAKRDDLNAGEHNFELRLQAKGERLSLAGSDRVQLLSHPIGFVTEYRPRFDSIPTQPVTPRPGPDGGTPPPTPDPSSQPLPGGERPTPPRGSEIVTTVADRSVDQNAFSDNYTLGYIISQKTGVYLQGTHSTVDYEQGIGLYDISTLRGTLGFGFQAFPKTSLFGEVFHGRTTTDPNFPGPNNPDVSFIGGFLGARGSFTPKLSGVIRVGYESREFEDDSSAPSQPVFDVSLNHRFSTKRTASLSYARLHDVSVQFVKESYTADMVNLQLSQAVGSAGRWQASIGASYGRFDYELENRGQRLHHQYSGNFSLAYQIQLWLSASFGYGFSAVRTESIDYEINRVSLSLAIGY